MKRRSWRSINLLRRAAKQRAAKSAAASTPTWLIGTAVCLTNAIISAMRDVCAYLEAPNTLDIVSTDAAAPRLIATALEKSLECSNYGWQARSCGFGPTHTPAVLYDIT